MHGFLSLSGRRRCRCRSAAAFGLAIFLAAAAPLRADPVPGEVLVRFATEVPAERIAAIEHAHGLERLHEIPHLRLIGYRFPDAITIDEMLARLTAHPEVEYAEPNQVRWPQSQPADPLFEQQWSLHNTGQRVNGRIGPAGIDIAWIGARQRFAGRTAVTVAVIDTGVAFGHPDLAGASWRNPGEIPGNGLDDDANGFVDDVHGWDFFDADADPSDENGHGTLVASQIAAASDDGIGIAGVAPTARIMALRILDDFGFSRPVAAMDLIRATSYAADNGARIVNLSLGGGAFSLFEREQFVWLDTQGVLVAAAAGNGGPDGRGDDNDVDPVYPASYDVPNILSVAALDRSGGLASFSNFGAEAVDLAAPGVDIVGAGLSRVVAFSEDFENPEAAVNAGWTSVRACTTCPDWGFFFDATGNTWVTDSIDASGAAIDYTPLADSWLLSPRIRLPAVGPRLDFRAWWDLDLFSDIAGAAVSRDPADNPPSTSFELLGAVVGTSSALPPGASPSAGTILSADLSPFAGEEVRLRFRLVADEVFERDGFYVDDVVVSGVDAEGLDGAAFQTLSGTSFAAPLVAGVAAMVMAQQPGLSHRDVGELLLVSARPVPVLAGRVRTGGRLDAEQALILAPEPTAAALAVGALTVLTALTALARVRLRLRTRR